MDGKVPARQSYDRQLQEAAKTSVIENKKAKCCGFTF
jgi:hypothetical protein